jgi:acetyltransferase-like isoleucine patch superfamily enzyme
MTDNIFFDVRNLKSLGSHVIIGKTVRIRYPELVEIGDNVIIDDFSYISTSLKIDDFVHIAAGAKIIGGRNCRVSFGSFSGLAPNVVLAAGSDDYVGGLATPLIDSKFKGDVEYGNIEIGKHCIVGANSVVLPNVVMHEGSALGALSLANVDLESWTLYAGVPARAINRRDQARIQDLERQFFKERQAMIEVNAA